MIYNLKIATVEERSEDDDEVAMYINQKQIEIIKCKPAKTDCTSDFVVQIKILVNNIMVPLVNSLIKHNCFCSGVVENITEFIIREAER